MTTWANMVLGFGEPLLCAAVLLAYLRSEKQRRYPAFFSFVILRLGLFVVLQTVLHIRFFLHHVPRSDVYTWYFYVYWSSYVATAVAIYFVVQELFQTATEPLPGVQRLGLVTFRWAAGLAVLAAIAAAITPKVTGVKLVLGLVEQIVRFQSMFELFLLLFLFASIGRLGLSYRSRAFGISFGFGIMAANDLICTPIMFGRPVAPHNIVALVNACAELLAVAIWCGYFLQNEPSRRTVTLPMSSTLARWNEVATALGQTSHPAAVAAKGDFFLQDVEQVVDRILTKNSLNAAG